MDAKHLVDASSRCSVAKASLAMIIWGVVSFVLFHLSSALFENCDETFHLDTDASLTITSVDTLNARNATSCRYSLVAPVNSIVEINCLLDISQPGSETCPIKRFFVSVDGMRDLRGADYFCSRNGSKRTVRRRSVMNRLVIAFATKAAVGDESFACVARRISSRCDCGWSRRARIFNGEDATMHEFPSILALVALNINRVFCGGVIISERWALTGAHCFNEDLYSNLSNVAVIAGEHDLTTRNETIYTAAYEIEHFVVHENYLKNSFDQDNDIALIRMAEPIVFNRAVGPACLPWSYTHDSFDNKFVEAVGFGLTNFYGESTKLLQKVSLQILPEAHCKDSIQHNAKMCSYAEKKDSCTSDSGGPLYFTSGRQIVIGLISYGVGCGSTTPSVNSRITSYLSWISKVTGDEVYCRK